MILTAAALTVAAGCAGKAPVTTTTNDIQAPAPAADRQLQSLDADAVGDLSSLVDHRADLPTSIPAADAAKVLVHIADADVAKAKPYGLQHRHGHGFGFRSFGRFGGLGLWGGLGFGGFWPGLSSLAYSSMLYYPVGSYAYPYSMVGSSYVPYNYLDAAVDRIAPYSTIYPFLYRSRGLYRPYFLI